MVKEKNFEQQNNIKRTTFGECQYKEVRDWQLEVFPLCINNDNLTGEADMEEEDGQ